MRDDVTGNDNYYLEDHVWIWKALRTIETIGREKTQTPKEQNRSRKEAATRDSGKTETAPRRYSSNEAQKQILKRFTSENTALKQRTRMLAVYRSSSEIRFMLRSRDTALFHCMNFHFFRTPESDNLVDVWKNTLAAQVNHEENEMTGWDTPLRYALALVMAIEGWKINQASTDKIFSEARRVLFESLWANGLFPGFLNYSDKKPEIFQDVDHRDNYWHTTFEVPYLLWKYAKKRLEQGADNKKDTNPASTNQLLKDGMDTKPDSQAQETNAVKVVMVAKKIMPFNNLINQKSIIEPPDEWLYNEPDFLNFVPDWNGFNLPLDDPSMHKIAKASENPMKNHVSRGTKIQLRDWIQLISDSIFRGEEPFLKMLETIEAECSTARESIPQQGSDENIKDVDRSILDRIPAKWKEEMRQLAKKFSSLPPNADPKNIIAEVMSKIDEIPFLSKGAIIDVKRWPRKDRKNKTPSDPLREARMLENEEILLRLTTQRTCPSDQNPADGRGESVVVKKRLIWLPLSDRVTAKICRHLTPASEKENMFSFFERHKTYDKFFFDDTTAASNTWKTELQLSFYEQYDQDHVLSRAAMGFRFDGDFFDRYWTCHFIEHKPKTEIVNININELSRILQREGNLPKTERGKQPWRQRKVLELILFDRIVEEIITSTDGIMRTIREELKDNTKSMRNTTKDSSYKSDNKHSSGEWVFRECSIWNMEESCHSAKPGETSSKDDALEDAIRAAKFVSNMKSEHYQSFSQKSQVLEQILRVLDDDLGESLEQIKRWERRDDDRAPEKPRWTRNDERRYRTTITKMLGSNDKKIRELEQCRSNVQSLKASLQSTREYIRDDLNLRSAEDVRLFTYVTATFLPISFATSIFSMGGSPGGALLGKMICVATVALLLTGIALVYDKKLAVIARHFRTFILYLISQGSRVIKASLRPLQVRKHSEKDDGDEEPKLANVLPSIFQRSRGGAGNDPAEAEKGVRKRHVQ
ncbi:hypothetical protein SLS55_003789 [Diplodia seriata]|uniref:Mg2+ transporter zinc transport protein n=1 Tax=Diplodia seriata TaxID=420778 RepID=A0ABR3CNX5_9PEZI